jgi:Protein of unknown function (DUF3106)
MMAGLMAHFKPTTKLAKGFTALASFFVLSLGLSLVFATSAQAESQVFQSTEAVKPAIESRPTWSQLTPQQQAALKPIQADWSTLDASRKKKWLAVAQRYQKMTLEDQARMHSRMTAWSKLTPIQRTQARDNYSAVLSSPSSSADPAGKGNLSEQWAKYQALSPEKKASLAEKANKVADVAKTKPLSIP